LTNDSLPPGPPGKVERACCIAVGFASGGAGGYVAFERSNQLGSAVLLVIGGLFLLIGIQGTRLIRFTSGSNGVELEQKRRIIENAIKEAQDEGNLEKASGIAEGAAIVSPSIGTHARGLQYELQVSSAIVGMGYAVNNNNFGPDMGFDLTIRDAGGRIVEAELKAYYRPVPRGVVEMLALQSESRLAPLILISNMQLTRSAQEAVKNFPKFKAVQWRDYADNPALAATLEHMFSLSSNA
jgi:hypothetical protein